MKADLTSIPLSRCAELTEYVARAAPGTAIPVRNHDEDLYVTELIKAKQEYRNMSMSHAQQVVLGVASDGSSADYYKLPPRSTQLQDLIAAKNMNAQIGEIFRATYRYGQCPHSSNERELNKIIFYAKAELARLKKYDSLENL